MKRRVRDLKKIIKDAGLDCLDVTQKKHLKFVISDGDVEFSVVAGSRRHFGRHAERHLPQLEIRSEDLFAEDGAIGGSSTGSSSVGTAISSPSGPCRTGNGSPQ